MDQRQEIELPAATAIPLGFIANELIMNAAKYGTGRIMVRLEPNPEKGYALSVSNDGSGLPEGFDLADNKGLGMRLIQSLVGRIGRMSCLANFRERTLRKAWKHAVFDVGMIR